MKALVSERDLAFVAAALAGPGADLTKAERALLRGAAPKISQRFLQQLKRAIRRNDDPLGNAFCELRSPETRRAQGAVYTPNSIIDAMLNWAAEGKPDRLVDPGAGSGRFLLAGASVFPKTELVAVEIDPLAALMLRANAAILKVSDRLTVHLVDYRALDLPEIDGTTLFIGNPPYVRHHDIPPEWKTWLAETAKTYGFKASKLAGLHIHFFLKTRQLAQPGDYGAFITSAEWMDVNYGDVLRKLLTNGLGGAALHVISPAAMPFADAATTGAITCFEVGRSDKRIRLRSVNNLAELNNLKGGRSVASARLDGSQRWSTLLKPASPKPKGYVELGELCRVHRGQVTGRNEVWILGAYTGALPNSLLKPTVTKAHELLAAGPRLANDANLRRVIDLPVDLGELDERDRRQVRRFLRWAKSMEAEQSYVARNRKAWWAVNLYEPAPILCTYMARRSPAFVRNLCGARLLNIAHGIYPREPMAAQVLDALSAWLQDHVCVSEGRTYAGGLTKFEPKELERVLVPPLEQLNEYAEAMDVGRTDRRCRNSEDAVSGTADGRAA